MEEDNDPLQAAQDTASTLASAAFLEDLEERYVKVVEDRDGLQSQLTAAQAELSTTVQQLATAQATAQERAAQTVTLTSQQQQLTLALDEKKMQLERNDRLQAESDNLRQEITRLLASNKELSQQLASAETQAKLNQSDAIPLHHAKERLERELASTESHSNWLQQELDAKQQDYQHLQSSSRDRAIRLQLQLDATNDDFQAVNATLAVKEKVERELQDKLETVSRDNLELKQEMQDKQEAFETELQDKDRLTALQKEQLVRWEKRFQDVVRENENLKQTAQQALAASDKELEEARESVKAQYTALLEEQASEYNAKLKQLKSSTTAIGDRVLLESAASVEQEEDDGPVNMTDLYERLEKAKTALRLTRNDCRKWELLYNKLLKDLQAKTPEMIRQREEFEMAVTQNQDLEQRLDAAIQERDDALADAKDARTESSYLEKRIAERDAESRELAKQVQALLISRSGGTHDSSVPVTVQEIQSQNQRLLADHRRLTNQVEDLEGRLQTDMLRKKLDAAETEVHQLKEQQKEQEVFVGKIVDQRDLYRALLNKSDSKALGSESEELTALELVKQQSENAKRYEHLNMELEGQLKTVRSEIDAAVREKENFEERVQRFEAANTDLLEKTRSLERELISSRSEVARRVADAEYHKEKCERIEESLERAREEIVNINNSRTKFREINAELEIRVGEVQSERSRLETEKSQTEAKVRLIETQLATAKAGESREVEENRQLRSEVARQGALIDHVRRIEASLNAKSQTDKESMRNEIESLTRKLESSEKKYTAEVENLKTRVEEATARISDLQSASQKHQADSLKSKKELLEAKTELQGIKLSLKTAESQLRAAKRKLGEGNDIEDVELTLQNRIDSLESELQSGKDEIAALKESSENYQKLAKASEDALKELREATDTYKETTQQEVAELQERLSTLSKENLSKQELVRTLTLDLTKEKDEHDKQQLELRSEIEALKTNIEANAKDVDTARASDAALKHDIQTLREEVSVAQNNYERELSLHSQARSALRAAQEKSEDESRERAVADNKVVAIKNELESQREAWQNEKSSIEDAKTLLEKSIQEARDQNKVLHEQLETLTSLVEKSQVSTDDPDADSIGTLSDPEAKKLMREQNELVRFLRAENELVQTELDTAKREKEREKASSNVVRRSLEEARAELEVLRSRDEENEKSKQLGDLKEVSEKLQASEEQLNLLKDSNKLLREETDLLKTKLSETQKRFEEAKASALPAESVQRKLGAKITSLEAEKESLARELESWKGRMTSLVSNFNQIDPEEHRQLVTQVEVMKKEKESLNAWKKTTEEESTRLRAICKKLKQQCQEQMKSANALKLEVKRVATEKEDLEKQSSTVSTAVVKERNELKEAVAEMEKAATSKQSELDGQTRMNQRLRDKLREFQSTIRSLREKQSSTQPAPDRPSSPKPSGESALPSEEKGASTDSSATTKEMGEKPALSTDTSSSAPPPQKVPPKPQQTKTETPQVPTGGFKFGPSKPVPNDGGTEKKEAQPPTLRATASSFVPGASSHSVSQKSAPVPPKPTGTFVQNAPKQLPEAAVKDAEKALATRRLSGEKRELSMKEKLLEKKRKLAESMVKAQKRKKEAAAKIASSSPEGQPAKKHKPDEPQPSSVPPPTSKVDNTQVDKVAAAEESGTEKPPVDSGATQSSEEKTSDDSKIDVEEKQQADDGEIEEKKKEVQQEAAEVEVVDKGDSGTPAVEENKTETKPEAGKPMAAAPFGQGSPFGASSTSSAPVSFGQSTSVAKPGTFGSSFLNIKPPGSSTTAPTFSFGTAGSITLPTPALPTAPGPFGAFSGTGGGTAGSGFGAPAVTSTSAFAHSGMQARPLFGDTPKEEDEVKDKDEEETNEQI